MNDPEILMRWYDIVCPLATWEALLADLVNIPTAQPGEFSMSTELGPEHAPGEGLASTVTHRMDAPMSANETFMAARAIVQTYAGAMIQDTRWLVLDDDILTYVNVEHAGRPMKVMDLHFYDETILG